MRSIIISHKTDTKLGAKHDASLEEVNECFDNKCGMNLIDDREEHRTDPPTLWFIAETNVGRLLKIIYIYKDGNFIIKSAFDPDQTEINIYEKHGK
ncbi:ADP-ribosyl-(dinitrogen reductase) hydrolase [Undibacterium sp. Rencai35W]|uniref:ADP-ribosyl-(dinitrogen reductase) hydrolase n=1 Tax=Undibacterium sp. Rencai35W TaxID=3413046 RepID=UPI003BF3FB18